MCANFNSDSQALKVSGLSKLKFVFCVVKYTVGNNFRYLPL